MKLWKTQIMKSSQLMNIFITKFFPAWEADRLFECEDQSLITEDKRLERMQSS